MRGATRRNAAFVMLFFSSFAGTFLRAQDAYVIKCAGTVRIESATGVSRQAIPGHAFAWNEFIVTGGESSVSLWMPTGTRIDIAEDSALGCLFTGTGADPRPVFVPERGSVSFSVRDPDKTGLEIRAGNLFARLGEGNAEVFAGSEGSVLVSLNTGTAELGSPVELGATSDLITLKEGESAEVRPGDGWTIREDVETDFTAWNEGKTKAFLADPAAALQRIVELIEGHYAARAALETPYDTATREWRSATDQYRQVLAHEDETARRTFQTETLFPAQDERERIIRQMDFHERMARSLRRSVVPSIYMEIKSRYPTPTGRSDTIREFFTQYRKLAAQSDIAP